MKPKAGRVERTGAITHGCGAPLETTTKPAVDSLSPTAEKWGEGISKERDNSMERAPLPARASQGEGPLQQWWVFQDAPTEAPG